MSRFDCFPCTPIFNTSIQITDPPTSHRSNDRSPNRSIDFERSSVNFKGFHLRTGSLSLSLPLKKFDRDILIACAKNTKGEVSRRKQLEAIWSPESGAHQRKPNFLPSFIDANILFDSDLLETRHVRAVETTFGRGSASGLSRERPFLLQWITEFRTRDDKFREFPRPFLLNDIAIFDRVLGGSNPVFYFYLLFVGFIVRSYVLGGHFLFFLFLEGFHIEELELYLRY